MLTEVCNVCTCVEKSKEEDHPSDDFVKLDDVVQWKEEVYPCRPHPGQDMTKHQNNDEGGIEVKTGTTATCYGYCWSLNDTHYYL